ncbi:Plant regulator RWP-RK family protein [Klebsormidium nitens]|uniref:Plant regulator RWP-RK family protein n=1 Tax=Klebsormidium nitens TaxID=105231 RepID=A0A1Y1ILA0_KLENI|nr:Plant regulator RWP-RK family protein [Klebsormidium nitens]|eukprot:GAQ89911.1 Plant regulator RWP-RK family protein [Klebsormidium nitens]
MMQSSANGGLGPGPMSGGMGPPRSTGWGPPPPVHSGLGQNHLPRQNSFGSTGGSGSGVVGSKRHLESESGLLKRSSSFAGTPALHVPGHAAGDEGSVHRGSQGKAEAPKPFEPRGPAPGSPPSGPVETMVTTFAPQQHFQPMHRWGPGPSLVSQPQYHSMSNLESAGMRREWQPPPPQMGIFQHQGGDMYMQQFHEGGLKQLKENPRVQEEATVHSGAKRVHKISSENVHLYASQIGKGSPQGGGSGKESGGGGSKPQASKGGSGSQAVERGGVSGSQQSGKRKEMETGLTVKATLGQDTARFKSNPEMGWADDVVAEDTARFKLNPDMGWADVVAEVAKRLNVEPTSVKLKYLDDEQEWMLLSTDQDLAECIDIVRSTGGSIIKLMVRREEFGRQSNSHPLGAAGSDVSIGGAR